MIMTPKSARSAGLSDDDGLYNIYSVCFGHITANDDSAACTNMFNSVTNEVETIISLMTDVFKLGGNEEYIHRSEMGFGSDIHKYF